MKAGDCVRISNPRRGAVIGSVQAITTPAALPAIPDARFTEMRTKVVRRILEEWHVDQLAVLSYRWNGPPGPREVCFFALHIPGHGWHDLKRQPLTIEPAAQEAATP
jgi:hypothetical protein